MIKLDLWTHYRGIFEKSVRRRVGGDSSGNGNGWKAGRDQLVARGDEGGVGRLPRGPSVAEGQQESQVEAAE
jgi:hypothetical protein